MGYHRGVSSDSYPFLTACGFNGLGMRYFLYFNMSSPIKMKHICRDAVAAANMSGYKGVPDKTFQIIAHKMRELMYAVFWNALE